MAMDAHKRGMLFTCLMSYFLSIAMLYQISPFFQLYAERTCNASAGTVGLIFAALPFASFVFAFPAAELVIRYGARSTLMGSLLVLAGSTLAFGLSASVPAWLFWRVVQGAASAPIYNGISSTLAQTFVDPAEFAWVNALQEAVANAGFALGPMMGGFLFDWGSFETPFVVSAALHLLFVGLSALTPGRASAGEELLLADYEGDGEPAKEPQVVGWRHICYEKILWLGGAAVLIPGIYGALDPVLATHLRGTLGDDISDSAVGVLLSVPSLTSMLSCVFIPSLSRVFSASCLVVVGLMAVGVTCLALAVSDPAPHDFIAGSLGLETGSPAQWTVQVTLLLLLGAAGGISWTPILPDMIDIAANRVAEERQEAVPAVAAVSPAVASLFNAAAACGEAVGPTAGGLLISVFGFAGTNVLLAGLMVCYGVALAAEECRPDSLSIATPPHTPTSRVMPQLHLRSPVPHSLDECVVLHAHGPHHHS